MSVVLEGCFFIVGGNMVVCWFVYFSIFNRMSFVLKNFEMFEERRGYIEQQGVNMVIMSIDQRFQEV